MRNANTTTTVARRSYSPLGAAFRALGTAVVEILNVPVGAAVNLGLGVAEGAKEVYYRTFPESEVKGVAIEFAEIAGLNKYEAKALGNRARAMALSGHEFNRSTLQLWVNSHLDWARANPSNKARMEKRLMKAALKAARVEAKAEAREQKHERKLEALEAKAELELAKAEAAAELELAKAEAKIVTKAPVAKKKAPAKKVVSKNVLARRTA